MNNKDLKELNDSFPQLLSGQTIYIYGLVDPETKEIRYIGKSIRPVERLANHCNEISNCHRSHWIQSLKKKGLKPEMVILERIVGEWPWQESEKRWISYCRENGFDLVNNTDGGDGVSGLPEETRAKMASTWKGRKHKPESLIKIGLATSARRHSDETKEKMSKAHKGRKITWKEKVGEANRKFSPDVVNEILNSLNSGSRVIDLAAQYGVHRTTITKIKLGRYYEKSSA